jgi:CheY-like chemotaxis protein
MADDDMDDYYLFKTALYEVNESVKLTYFGSCDSLLDYLKTSNNLPDLIVLDINMPGTDGYNCLIAIKNDIQIADIPVIFYSTSSEPVLIQNAYDSGARQYIVKPYSIELLKEYIRELLVASASELDEPGAQQNMRG